MIFKDYYKILGLDTNKVTADEIKIAFREQAKKYHPDVNRQNEKSEERFKDINEAYRILSNDSTKRKYDRMWNSKVKRRRKKIQSNEEKKERRPVFKEFSYMFFGEKTEDKKTYKKSPIKGDNIDTEINIKLEDAYFGTEKKISLRTVNRKNEKFFSKNSRRY